MTELARSFCGRIDDLTATASSIRAKLKAEYVVCAQLSTFVTFYAYFKKNTRLSTVRNALRNGKFRVATSKIRRRIQSIPSSVQSGQLNSKFDQHQMWQEDIHSENYKHLETQFDSVTEAMVPVNSVRQVIREIEDDWLIEKTGTAKDWIKLSRICSQIAQKRLS